MANLVGGLHTLAQEFKQLGINLVNLLTAYVQLIVKLGVVGRLATPHNVVNHRDAILRDDLLCRVAPRLVGRVVALNHHTVEAEVGSLLCNALQERTATADVRRVANHHHLGEACAHLENHMPHRRVAVFRGSKV